MAKKGRQTVKVDWVRQKANYFLRTTDTYHAAERSAVSGFLESILMHTNNYKGFAYIRHMTGEAVSPEDVQAGNYDETRRHYY